MPRQRGTKIWGEMKGGETHSEKRDGKVEGQVGGGSGNHWTWREGRGERRKACSAGGSAARAPFEASPIILSEVPISLGEGALSSHSGPWGTWWGGSVFWLRFMLLFKVNKHTSPHLQIGKGGGWELRRLVPEGGGCGPGLLVLTEQRTRGLDYWV